MNQSKGHRFSFDDFQVDLHWVSELYGFHRGLRLEALRRIIFALPPRPTAHFSPGRV